MSLAQKNNKLSHLSLFICALCICIPAFINNFPFIYSDTGDYIGTGFSKWVSRIRPLTYGLFLRHISLEESFWLVIAVQAFLTAWFIQLFAKSFFEKVSSFAIIVTIAILTASTSIGVTTGMLMPDFTSPILILATAILLFSKNLKRWDFGFAILGLWFALACHHSHAYVLCLMLLGVVLKNIISKNKTSLSSKKRIMVVSLIMVVGYFTIPSIHYLRDGKFISSRSSNVFLMGRLNQMGLLKPFLDLKCPDKDYTICQHKNEIPPSFLWDPSSPVYKDGGWIANNQHFKTILMDFAKEPYYLKKFGLKTIETGTQQLFCFKTVKLYPLKPGKWPQNVFEKHMPDVVPALEKSAQNKGTWSSTFIDCVQYILVFSSALVMLYLFFFQNKYPIHQSLRNVAFLLLLAMISNAFICGGISMIAHRFQSRIIWLVPLFALFLCYQLYLDRSSPVGE